jgi:hypothetical protein
VLVDVIAMLKVAVAVMDVVHMIAMGDRLTAVSFGVRARVTDVHRLLGVVLVAVHVIDVVVVLDRLAPVTRVVLVIDRFSVRGHLSSSSRRVTDDTSVRRIGGAPQGRCPGPASCPRPARSRIASAHPAARVARADSSVRVARLPNGTEPTTYISRRLRARGVHRH